MLWFALQALGVGHRLYSVPVKLKSSLTAAAAASVIATELDRTLSTISFETVHLLTYSGFFYFGRCTVSDLDEKTLLNDVWFNTNGRLLALLLPPQSAPKQQQVGSKRKSAESASSLSERYTLVFNSTKAETCRQLPLLLPLPEGGEATGTEQEQQLKKALFTELELSGGSKWLRKEVLETRRAATRKKLENERQEKWTAWRIADLDASTDEDKAAAAKLEARYEAAKAAAEVPDNRLPIYYRSRDVEFYVHADAVDEVLEKRLQGNNFERQQAAQRTRKSLSYGREVKVQEDGSGRGGSSSGGDGGASGSGGSDGSAGAATGAGAQAGSAGGIGGAAGSGGQDDDLEAAPPLQWVAGEQVLVTYASWDDDDDVEDYKWHVAKVDSEEQMQLHGEAAVAPNALRVDKYMEIPVFDHKPAALRLLFRLNLALHLLCFPKSC
jgi:hypothetical protein